MDNIEELESSNTQIQTQNNLFKYQRKKQQLIMPAFLVKSYNQQSQTHTKYGYFNKQSPFHQIGAKYRPRYANTNPFQRKYLYVGRQVQKSNLFNPNIYSSPYTNIKTQQQYHKSWYFSEYQLEKLRYCDQYKRAQNIQTNSYISQPHSYTLSDPIFESNYVLGSIFKSIGHNSLSNIPLQIPVKSTIDIRQQQTKRGMFADIYSKVVKQPPENQQLRNLKKAQNIFFDILTKVKNKVKQQRTQQNQEEKILASRQYFNEFYIKMQRQKFNKEQQQQITKGKRFDEVYLNLRRANSLREEELQNDQVLKARAIFGEVYVKMYDGAVNEKQIGTADFQKQTQAKRLFDEVYSRVFNQIMQIGIKQQQSYPIIENEIGKKKDQQKKGKEQQKIQNAQKLLQKTDKQNKGQDNFSAQKEAKDKIQYPQKIRMRMKDYYLIN